MPKKPPTKKTTATKATKAVKTPSKPARASLATAPTRAVTPDAYWCWRWPIYVALRETRDEAAADNNKRGDDWADKLVSDRDRYLVALTREPVAPDATRRKQLLSLCKATLSAPRWFRGWTEELSRLQAEVDGLRTSPQQLQNGVRVNLQLYHLEVVADPKMKFAQVQRAAERGDAAMAETFGEVGMLDLLRVFVEHQAGPAKLVVISGNRRVATARLINRRQLDAWWRAGDLSKPPTLLLEAECQIQRGDFEKAMQVRTVLNTHRRNYTAEEQVEDAIRLKAAGLTISKIALTLKCGQTKVHHLLQLERLAAPLLALFFQRKLPSTCAYLLSTLEPTRQLELWKLVEKESNKFEALQRALGKTEPPRVAPAKPQADAVRFEAQLAKARTPEAAAVRDFLAAYRGDKEALARLNPELQAVFDMGAVVTVAQLAVDNLAKAVLTAGVARGRRTQQVGL